MKADLQKLSPLTIKLNQLEVDPVNVRKTGRGTEPKFAASIRKRGIYQRMIVRPKPNSETNFLIVDGGERYEALMFLAKKGETAKGVKVNGDYPVDVEVGALTDDEARNASLSSNLVRSSMHPVDEFEAFAAQIAAGATVEDLAAENAMKVPEVRQALSLAAIAEPIRKAWREGKIDGEAAEAYAQTKDLEHQVRVFNKLKGQAGSAWAVSEQLLGARDSEIGQMLKFVTPKAYEAAGHHINASLFDDDDRHPVKVDNVPALVAMYTKRLSDQCDALTKDGWGWALIKDEAPKDHYAWRRLPGGNPTKEQKANAGCTVDVDYNGNLKIERGYIKPGVTVKIPKSAKEKEKSRAKAGASANGGAGVISGALADTMSRQITMAAADALAADGALALRVVVAALATSEGPAQIDVKGMPELEGDDRHDNDFVQYLALTGKKSTGDLLKLLATWASKSLDMVAHRADQLPLTGEGREACAALLNEINAKALNAALRKRFDPKDYFSRISKALVVRAIEEALPKLSFNKAAKTAEIAKVAIENVARTGWLPPEFRAKGYDGPKAASVKAKPTAAKKAASKKKRL